MESFFQLLVVGIGLGCIYCLVAIEYTLIWKASGLINFAHERFIMLGAYIFAGTCILKLNIPVIPAILVLFALMGIFGIIVAGTIFIPLSRMDSNIYAVMGTIMLGKILAEVARLIWGPAPYNLPSFIKGSYYLGDISISKVYVIIMITTVLLMLFINILFKRTKLGKAMQCVAVDKVAASLMGINVNKNIAITVGLSSIICSIIGILVIPIFNVSLNMATMVALKGFAAGVVGGFGTISGAIAGGLLIGVVESVYTGIGPTVYRDAVAFILLIVFLLIKPTGIMNKKNE